MNTSIFDNKPLSDMVVLDFTQILGGPYCTKLLSDLGAYVIKVESCSGDHYRCRAPFRGTMSTIFSQLNRGKVSLSIDMKSKEGFQIISNLASTCDILVENFRPGVMDRLGLSYESVSLKNPKVIYCSITGFGTQGPLSHKAALAPIIHAYSGFDRILSQPNVGEYSTSFIKNPHLIADVLGGKSAFSAILVALLSRLKSNKGDRVVISLLDVMLSLQQFDFINAQVAENKKPQLLYRSINASDEPIIVAPTTDKNFSSLCHAICRPDLLIDPLFCSVEKREWNWDVLMKEIELWSETLPAEVCENILNGAGVPAARYLTIEQIISHPHMKSNPFFHEVVDSFGTYLGMGLPFLLTRVGQPLSSGECVLGGGNREVLQNFLGYDEDFISSLLHNNVIFQS
ncbi:CaiB/BaiF CoA transferase family protein [Pantoea agglomerans]|uniref:CaiB/BaiF CoA transferase family protein n=1 Tax=Enterobacter agglomerans TaxID=549 RepID=UPI000A66B568|nr:CoA transferase [Pantoea agglomerans]